MTITVQRCSTVSRSGSQKRNPYIYYLLTYILLVYLG